MPSESRIRGIVDVSLLWGNGQGQSPTRVYGARCSDGSICPILPQNERPRRFMTSHYSRCLETTHYVSVLANKHTLIRAYEARPPKHRKSRTPDPGVIGEAYLGEGCEDDCLTIDPNANGRQG
jgi:hypothetical protein